jgi:hypothetical protein
MSTKESTDYAPKLLEQIQQLAWGLENETIPPNHVGIINPEWTALNTLPFEKKGNGLTKTHVTQLLTGLLESKAIATGNMQLVFTNPKNTQERRLQKLNDVLLSFANTLASTYHQNTVLPILEKNLDHPWVPSLIKTSLKITNHNLLAGNYSNTLIFYYALEIMDNNLWLFKSPTNLYSRADRIALEYRSVIMSALENDKIPLSLEWGTQGKMLREWQAAKFPLPSKIKTILSLCENDLDFQELYTTWFNQQKTAVASALTTSNNI